jgi:molybdenum cofactor synthesis domain-containing protein
MASDSKTACLIVIGDEILSGRTQDANLKYLANWLNGEGIQLAEARVIGDDEAVIIETLNHCRKAFDYVFTTGGIGPTHDDITALSIARAFGVELELRDEIKDALGAYNDKVPLNEARLKMAYIPLGAELIENSVSIAPGFRVENVFVLAGIPAVMRAMLEALGGRLVGASCVVSKSITAFIGESGIAMELGEIQDRYPGSSVGSYPFYKDKTYGTSLVVRSSDSAMVDAAINEIIGCLEARDIRFEFGEPDDD